MKIEALQDGSPGSVTRPNGGVMGRYYNRTKGVSVARENFLGYAIAAPGRGRGRKREGQ